MRFRSLESRIVTLFLVLIVAVQVVGLLVIQQGIDNNARTAISAELNNGAKVFRRLLEQNAQSLRFGARLLARDTAFVAAIGNNDESDRATIESALANSGRRIRASLTMLIGDDRKISATTNPKQSAALETMALSMLDAAEAADGSIGIAIVDHRPFQIVAMPIKAPITIGWIVMTFPIDRQLANDMREVTSLHTSVLTRDAQGKWLAVGSTFVGPSAQVVVDQLQALRDMPTGPFDMVVETAQYSARLTPIGEDNGQIASVLLARSIDEATAEYRRLERWLIGLTLGGILASALAIVFTAKRIAQPISQLAVTAKRLEEGDYKVAIDSTREDEIGALAHAFDAMREGIAKREQEIRRLAYWDTLTNLPNRAQFVLLLNDALHDARPPRGSAVRADDGPGPLQARQRRDGPQFRRRLAAPGGGPPAAAAGQSPPVLGAGGAPGRRRIRRAAAGRRYRCGAADGRRDPAALETPLSLEDQMVDIGAGLGIAGYPEHADDGETLLSMAEVAMYTAKQRNDGAVVYDAAMDKSSAKSLSLLTELRNAIERNEFRLHVQPKISLQTGRVVGMEALVRWVHPERGNVFPDEFIPFAEQTGFIRVLTRWVMESRPSCAASWPARAIT
jgi:GGDEF domain-containing protein